MVLFSIHMLLRRGIYVSPENCIATEFSGTNHINHAIDSGILGIFIRRIQRETKEIITLDDEIVQIRICLKSLIHVILDILDIETEFFIIETLGNMNIHNRIEMITPFLVKGSFNSKTLPLS